MRWTIALLLGLWGCSSGDDFEATCEPGVVRECPCDDGSSATQACASDGSKWGACSCEPDAPEPELCVDDGSCLELDAPACVDGECVDPIWVGGGESCEDPATRCVAGYRCAEEAGWNCITR
jgi:hypothetical protein